MEKIPDFFLSKNSLRVLESRMFFPYFLRTVFLSYSVIQLFCVSHLVIRLGEVGLKKFQQDKNIVCELKDKSQKVINLHRFGIRGEVILIYMQKPW